MATRHAIPGEIDDLAGWEDDLSNEKTKIIIKTDKVQLARLVIPKGREYPSHKVSGPLVVQCIQGRIEFTAMGMTKELNSGQLLYLMPGEPHSLKAVEDAVILLTIIIEK